MLWHGVQACTAPGLMQIDQTCVSEVMCMASCGTVTYGVWQLFQTGQLPSITSKHSQLPSLQALYSAPQQHMPP
jgi:hypothetical protein